MVNLQYGFFRTDTPIVPGTVFTAGQILIPSASGYTVATTSTYSGYAFRIVDPNYNSSRRDVIGLENTAAYGGPGIIVCDSSLISGVVNVLDHLNTISGSFVTVTGTNPFFAECVAISNGVYTIQTI